MSVGEDPTQLWVRRRCVPATHSTPVLIAFLISPESNVFPPQLVELGMEPDAWRARTGTAEAGEGEEMRSVPAARREARPRKVVGRRANMVDD